MLTFERVTEQQLDIIREIIHSNRTYNEWENGSPVRTDEELKKEYFHNNPNRYTYFIKADETYIGLLEYLERNEKDGLPWLGLLIIHGDYQGYGFGTNAYYTLEDQLKQKGITRLRLGILRKNVKAKVFWESLGFSYFETKSSNKGILVDCYEKEWS
ncbi:MAG: GNAT family N-acetyltransferase [Ectobacillus sp.]